jgi:hypothetical protein
MKTNSNIVNFEDVISHNSGRSLRSCRSLDFFNSSDYEKVKNNKGESCMLSVSGGGMYTQWYLYHSVSDNKLYYIFRTCMADNDASDYYFWDCKEFNERDLEY